MNGGVNCTTTNFWKVPTLISARVGLKCGSRDSVGAMKAIFMKNGEVAPANKFCTWGCTNGYLMKRSSLRELKSKVLSEVNACGVQLPKFKFFSHVIKSLKPTFYELTGRNSRLSSLMSLTSIT